MLLFILYYYVIIHSNQWTLCAVLKHKCSQLACKGRKKFQYMQEFSLFLYVYYKFFPIYSTYN